MGRLYYDGGGVGGGCRCVSGSDPVRWLPRMGWRVVDGGLDEGYDAVYPMMASGLADGCGE
jgi:hypothetical protein